jgi:hypothetical protein
LGVQDLLWIIRPEAMLYFFIRKTRESGSSFHSIKRFGRDCFHG